MIRGGACASHVNPYVRNDLIELSTSPFDMPAGGNGVLEHSLTELTSMEPIHVPSNEVIDRRDGVSGTVQGHPTSLFLTLSVPQRNLAGWQKYRCFDELAGKFCY